MKALLKSLGVKAGFRGFFLFALGLYDIAYGTFYTILGPLPHAPFGGERSWGIAINLEGLFLFTGIFLEKDLWHFAVEIFLGIAWAFEYFWLSMYVPYDWIRGLTFLASGLIVMVVMSWPEPMWIWQLRNKKK